MKNDTPLTDIKGVGRIAAQKLESAGLITVDDLMNYFPRRYDDYSRLVKVKDLEPGKVSIKVNLEELKSRRARRGLSITEAAAKDESGRVGVVWFNQPYRAKSIRLDKQYLLSGEYGFQFGRMQIVNPSLELVEDIDQNQSGKIMAVYPERGGLNSSYIRRLIKQISPYISELPETLPIWLVEKYELISHSQAILAIHQPVSSKQIEQAKTRLGFEELFVLMMASKQIKDQNIKVKALAVPFDQVIAKKFVENLPFKMTDAQRRCVWQIYKDIDSQEPMNRLIEGDVGSGKTVIAAMASLMVANAGLQVAFLAPTELLANQHADTMSRLLEHSPLKNKLALLTGSVKPKTKQKIKSLLRQNEISIIVGTHALLQESVDWHKLGLVIVDEQHRFGVQQRQKLLLKAGHMPHVLCLTATPIPRSLALTVYGELDISILDQSPSHRAGVKTRIVSPNSLNAMFKDIDRELKKGRQAYIVCPLISESEALQAVSAEKLYEQLSKNELKQWRIGLLHGRLSSEEKDKVMLKYVNREIDVLVSTTVIEVGVDVANATVMAIFSADRFGLAQLHQLRGRVGRAEHQGICYLVMSDSAKPSKRIVAISQTNDGFKLSELDLEIRGPGAIYGFRQHGLLDLKIAQLTDAKLIAITKQALNDFINSDESLLKYRQIADKVKQASKLTYLN